MLVDYRCPMCNATMRGRQEVAIVKKLPPANVYCPNCDMDTMRVKSSVEAGFEGTDCYHYETDNPAA